MPVDGLLDAQVTCVRERFDDHVSLQKWDAWNGFELTDVHFERGDDSFAPGWQW